MLIFLDSNIVIYLVEQTPGFGPKATARIQLALAAGARFAVTDLVRLESRLGPIAGQDQKLLADFNAFFAHPQVRILPMPSAVYDRATNIRAKHKFKLGDALHIAAAVEHGCDRFLTNDSRLNKFPDIVVEVLT